MVLHTRTLPNPHAFAKKKEKHAKKTRSHTPTAPHGAWTSPSPFSANPLWGKFATCQLDNARRINLKFAVANFSHGFGFFVLKAQSILESAVETGWISLNPIWNGHLKLKNDQYKIHPLGEKVFKFVIVFNRIW